MRKPNAKPGQIHDPVIVYTSGKQTLVFDNLKDVRATESMVDEGERLATALARGDISEETLKEAGDHASKMDKEAQRHRNRTIAYVGTFGKPKPGSLPYRLLASSNGCYEQLADSVAGLRHLIDNKGRIDPKVAAAAGMG